MDEDSRRSTSCSPEGPGSGDVLIFDSAVSGEYLRLARSQTLTVDELDDIRINGLRDLGAARA